jgi:hypothetical protein
MFNYRGDCYYEVGDYKNAIAEFEGMLKLCDDPSLEENCKTRVEKN